ALMVRLVLVPLDGSDHAEQALGPASCLARQVGANLLLLRAAGDTTLPAGPDYPLARSVEESTAYLKQIRQRLVAAGLTVHIEVTTHDPGAAIPLTAALRGADLIAMCAHGHAGLRPTAGSVAQQVLRSTQLPVLLASGHDGASAPSAFRSLLIPLDGTASAESALRYVGNLTKDWSPVVRLLRVVEPAMPPLIPGFPGYTPSAVFERAAMETQYVHMDARRYVERTAQTHMRGFPCQATAIVGYPAKAILDECANSGADLLVMATRERPEDERLSRRSVTAYVLRHARVPVLLLRGAPPELRDAKIGMEIKTGTVSPAMC
ncbi:MAG: universal stress protein, partial [Chloroflexota bacterium]